MGCWSNFYPLKKLVLEKHKILKVEKTLSQGLTMHMFFFYKFSPVTSSSCFLILTLSISSQQFNQLCHCHWSPWYIFSQWLHLVHTLIKSFHLKFIFLATLYKYVSLTSRSIQLDTGLGWPGDNVIQQIFFITNFPYKILFQHS